MIILKNLKWNKCFSYGENNELILDEAPVTQIVGENGTGKSSIALIIEELLYNKNSKGIKKAEIPNREFGEGYQIEGLLIKDGTEYKISVNRGSNIKVKLYEDGIDISSHTATNTFKTIEEILGMDYKTFSQLVYQNTNSSLQFLTATDTNRKKFLIDLLHLEEYMEKYEIFKDIVKEFTMGTALLEGKVDTISKWLNKTKEENLDKLPEVEVTNLDYSEQEKEIASLNEESNNINSINKRIQDNELSKSILAGINIQVARDPQIKYVSYDDKQSQLGAVRSGLTAARKICTDLGSLEPLCPTCGQDIDISQSLAMVEKAKKEDAVLSIKYANLEGEIAQIKANNVIFDSNEETVKRWEELYKSIDRTMDTELLDLGDLQDSIDTLKIEVASIKSTLTTTMEEQKKVAVHNSRVDVLLEQMVQYDEELDTVSIQLNSQQKELGNLEVLKKSFSTNGLVAYKIENSVKDLENEVNKYLAEFSAGRFTIEFNVTNDKLNVDVTDNGISISIAALSSGELARVNTSTLLALRKLMSTMSKNQLNILFLDEVINTLDETGKEKLVELLLEENNLNTYIVSHQWTHPLLSKIEVVKEDNISRIVSDG